MSLVAYAIRTCLWRALYGETYAEDRVHDSSVAALDEMVSGDARPFLIVSTDDDAFEMTGHDFAAPMRKLDVVIEIVVATVQRVGGDGEEPGLAISIAETDDGFETLVNFISRQVFRVMQVGEGPFAELFRVFTPGDKRITAKRGADTKPRYAARQIVITCDTLAEPDFGVDPEGAWADLIAAMDADEILGPLAADLRKEIVGDARPEWRHLQARLGLTRKSQLALGVGPFLPGEAPAPFVAATIESTQGDRIVTGE